MPKRLKSGFRDVNALVSEKILCFYEDMIIRELRRRAHQFIGPSIALCAVVYFAYHMIQGERGLLAWQKLEAKVHQTEAEFAALQREHDILETRVKLLRDESLCPDLLNERAKKVLGYIHPNEVVVIRKK